MVGDMLFKGTGLTLLVKIHAMTKLVAVSLDCVTEADVV